MSTYLVPMNEGNGAYIKRIVASSEKSAKEKLFKYLFDKYEDLEGDTLEDIDGQLWDLGIDLGQLYDIEEFV